MQTKFSSSHNSPPNNNHHHLTFTFHTPVYQIALTMPAEGTSQTWLFTHKHLTAIMGYRNNSC